MKRMEIFCSSPGSIAICSSIEQRSMVRRSHKTSLLDKQQSPRTSSSSSSSSTDFHQRIKINKSQYHVPCSSQLPINPKHVFEKTRKSTSCSSAYYTKKATSDSRRKSSADIYDLKGHRDDISSRYLLSETPSSFVVDWFPETSVDDRVKLVVASDDDHQPTTKAKFVRSLSNSTNDSSPMLRSSSSSTRTRHQVVVLRVSLHCKGCEGKVKKHLSKMEGVTSYSIDMAAKKVTVIGDITPLGVLASVSKVKNAQLWPSPTSSSSPSSPWSA